MLKIRSINSINLNNLLKNNISYCLLNVISKDSMMSFKKFNNIYNSSIYNFHSNNKIINSNSNTDVHIWGEDKDSDIDMFKKQANLIIDMLCDEFLKADEGTVLPKVKPNFLKSLINDEFNNYSESFDSIKNELETKILPNFTKIHHKGYLSWFPCMQSFPGMLGQQISHSFINPSCNYQLSSVIFELERKITNWFKRAYGLPDNFNQPTSTSIIYHGVSLSSIATSLAAKRKKLKEYPHYIKKFKYYSSDEAHYSIRKAANISGFQSEKIPIKYCKIKNNYIMNFDLLKEKIENDVKEGYIPCYIAATLGTTGTTGIDDLEEIGQLAKKYNMWYHVDAAYAGNALILEKYREYLKGVEYADSFCFNPVKLFPILQNSACCFYKDSNDAILAYDVENKNIEDIFSVSKTSLNVYNLNYNDFEFSISRLNKALKIYTLINSCGFSYLKETALKIFDGASTAEKILKDDKRFEVMFYPSKFGLVVFKLRYKENEDLMKLINYINEEGRIFIGPMNITYENKELIVVRLSINWLYTSKDTIKKDIQFIIEGYNKLFK